MKVDKHLFRALAQYWNPAYCCFTFGKVDLVPTVEEYMTLLRFTKIQADKVYSRAANISTFLKKLMSITGMSEQWVIARIKQKGDSKYIHWKNLRGFILAHLDMKKRVDVFALSIYSLVVFPKALGHVDEVISDLFDRFDKKVTPVPTILAEIFRFLNACRRTGEGSFIGCAQLLLAWFHSNFWKVEDVEWRAPLMIPDEILYRCGDFDWVPLLGIWGAIRFVPLLVLRVNDNIPVLNQENVRPIEEHLQVILSELEIIKQDFEKRSLELGRKIEQLEEEKMRLGLDVDI
ncbi:hypothetical protein Gotur_014067 [Gossypium turneri]